MAESESQAEVANPHSAETEYWPKVKNSPHSAPKPKPTFGRPLPAISFIVVMNIGFSSLSQYFTERYCKCKEVVIPELRRGILSNV